jgi:hypothetical protein
MYVLSNALPGFDASNVSIAELSCAANKMIEIHRIKITQSTSESDDSSRIEWGTYTTTGTGTTVTGNAKPVDPGDSAYAGVAKDDHSTAISVGEDILGREGWSALAGMEKIFLPKSRPIIRGAEFFGLQMRDGITPVTLVYEIEFEEKG